MTNVTQPLHLPAGSSQEQGENLIGLLFYLSPKILGIESRVNDGHSVKTPVILSLVYKDLKKKIKVTLFINN